MPFVIVPFDNDPSYKFQLRSRVLLINYPNIVFDANVTIQLRSDLRFTISKPGDQLPIG